MPANECPPLDTNRDLCCDNINVRNIGRLSQQLVSYSPNRLRSFSSYMELSSFFVREEVKDSEETWGVGVLQAEPKQGLLFLFNEREDSSLSGHDINMDFCLDLTEKRTEISSRTASAFPGLALKNMTNPTGAPAVFSVFGMATLL